MKYYYRQHTAGYARLLASGKAAWHELHDGKPFDDFPSRAFLASALPRLRFKSSPPRVLELGCGTGPGACFLAEQGFSVHGVDLIPEAVEMARSIASDRGLSISFEVADIVQLSQGAELFDLIVDSYCLQGIVTDEDRQAVFSGVRSRLSPEGYYLISSACFDPVRFVDGKVAGMVDGRPFYQYGDNQVFDARTEVVYIRLGENEDRTRWEEALEMFGSVYLPYRRHRKPNSLRREVEAAGFAVSYQDGGHLVCSHPEMARFGDEPNTT